MHKTLPFCCFGCRTVYQILEAKNALDSPEKDITYLEAKKHGLISAPLIENSRLAENEKKWVVEISNLWCPACGELIALILKQKKGIIDCRVDYMTDVAAITYDPSKIERDEIRQAVERLGYEIHEFTDPSQLKINRSLFFKASIGTFASLNVMMFAYPLYATYFDFDLENLKPILAYVSLGLTLPVMLYTGASIYHKMWLQIRHGVLAMETLVGLGTLAAFILSLWEIFTGTYQVYFDTIAVLLTFLIIGKILETRLKFSSKEALLRVQHSLPKKARKRMQDGSLEYVLLKDIEVGDKLAALHGEQIVTDGVLIEGRGSCDESHLTGEPLPKFKEKGAIVLAGSIVKEGSFIYESTSSSSHSTIAHILNIIEKGLLQKTESIGKIEKVLEFFIPLVFLLSFSVFLFFPPSEALKRALSLLLIACPCAIGIAIPLVETRLLHRFSERGMLVRNRNLFYLFPRITHFIFDKTGTLTQGEFEVDGGMETLAPKEKRLLKGLTSHSNHPLSQTLNKAIKEMPQSIGEIKEIPGYGIQGLFEGSIYSLGSYQFALSKGLNPVRQSGTTCYFMHDRAILATLTFKDRLKEDAKALIDSLLPARIALVSGDQEEAVQSVATQLSITHWISEATPLHKQQYLQKLKLKHHGAKICMLGDGINDAPALSLADISISVASATEISKHVSDLILTKDDIIKVVEGIGLSKKGVKLINQNLFWAFVYNVLGLFLAFFGLLTPLFASFAMIASSLLIHLNSKRI